MGIALSSLRCRLPYRNQEPPLQFQPGEASSFLPNDVIFDILSRIPVKALCRLRCVSREWCALISGPDFVAAHKSCRPAEPLIVAASYRDKTCQLKLIDMDGCLVKVIIDMGNYWRPACTGPHDVICVTGCYEFKGYIAGVIDLTTMKVLATCLPCNDPDKAWGIGVAVPSGACKVVRWTSRLSEVFTIGDAADWRPIKSLPSCNGYYKLHRYPVEVNGMLYFLTETQPDEDLSVLPFDLEREEWKDMIKGPPNVKVRPTSISLAQLNGTLCMVQPEIWKLIYGHINIWRLLDSQKSIWVIAYTIPYDPCKYYQMAPLRVLHDDGPKLLLCNATRTGGVPGLQIYDPRDGKCVDATKKLLSDHVSDVNCNVSIGICNMQLEHFVSPKNQHISTLSEVFL